MRNHTANSNALQKYIQYHCVKNNHITITSYSGSVLCLLSVRVSTDEVVRWSESFDHLLSHKYGLAAFRTFLKSEFSDENIEFWMACEEYKKIKSSTKLVSKANKIFQEFIDIQAPREVNIDYRTREKTKQSLEDPSPTSLNEVQGKVYGLMEKDSYPRFLRSKMYQDMVNRANAHGQRRSV
uniref:Regulator of G-protein signaling 8 n=1 Tax=Gasterosteus aculeatus aculeatus TaxID=481459 RepID=A0AAQ4PM46_GASAC